jgi:hypothetical protein
MLAVKLHKTPKPWLGKKSHLVPIVSWEAGKLQLRRWIWMLTGTSGRKRSNNKINYLTLVRIPDDHPVEIYAQYGNSNFIKQVLLQHEMSFREIPQEFKQALKEWWDAWLPPWQEKSEPGGLMSDEPQIVLARRLPDECILWTKNIRLLYSRGTNKKKKTLQKIEEF